MSTARTFDEWSDFLDFARSGRHGLERASRAYEWDGAVSYHEAERLAIDGWHELVEEVEATASWIERQVTQDRSLETTFDAFHDVEGAEVDIARYLSGEPECMVQAIPVQVPKTARTVRLCVSNGVRAQVTTQQFIARGAAVVALIDILRRTQRPLEVWVGSRTSSGQEYVACVQPGDQPLHLGRIMFAIAHPAAHRKLGFAARQAGWKHLDYGLGSESLRESDLPEVDGDSIVLPMLQATDDWSPEASRRWIDQQLDNLLGAE